MRLDELGVDPKSLRDDGKTYTHVQKPWGEERELHLTDDCSVWRLSIYIGQETSLHCHPNKMTVLIVESGEVEVTTLNESYQLKQGQSLLIERGVFHRTKAKYGAEVIELEWPPNRCDLVRLEDKYGRDRTGYASS